MGLTLVYTGLILALLGKRGKSRERIELIVVSGGLPPLVNAHYLSLASWQLLSVLAPPPTKPIHQISSPLIIVENYARRSTRKVNDPPAAELDKPHLRS